MILAERKHSSPRRPRLKAKVSPVLKAKRRRKIIACFQVVGFILFCFGFGLFYIYKHSQVAAIGYEIESTKHNIAVLQRENKRLELQVAELQGLDRVEEVARVKLGMVKPENVMLAALPAEADKVSGKQVAASKKSKTDPDAWSLVAKRLIGRAEASPR